MSESAVLGFEVTFYQLLVILNLVNDIIGFRYIKSGSSAMQQGDPRCNKETVFQKIDDIIIPKEDTMKVIMNNIIMYKNFV